MIDNTSGNYTNEKERERQSFSLIKLLTPLSMTMNKIDITSYRSCQLDIHDYLTLYM